MPILGIIASSFRSAAGPEGAYDALATVTVPSGGVASITFAGIPTGYKHLQLRMMVRSTSGDATGLYFFNGDTTESNYYSHFLVGNGSAANAYAYNNPYSWVYPAAASTFGVAVMDILDYANTSKFKTLRTLRGNDGNGSGTISLESGLWKNTAAVTSLRFNLSTPANIAEYSSFALYGVK